MHKVLLNLTFLGESLFDPLAHKVRGTLSPGNYCMPELGPVNRPQTVPPWEKGGVCLRPILAF